jgi:hypothetical protein
MCFKLASKEHFRTNKRECKNCYKHRMGLYYAANKEQMKEKIREANKTRYQKQKLANSSINTKQTHLDTATNIV